MSSPYIYEPGSPFSRATRSYSDAQSRYAGPGWNQYLELLGGADRLAPQGRGLSLAGPGPARPGDEDSARSIAANLAIVRELDARDPRANAPLDAVEAELRDMRAAAEVKRAAAIANDPRSSAFGRPIVQRPDASYSENAPVGADDSASARYVTASPAGQPPVNRQALAAQMAPGLIAPPPPDKPVTYGDPKPMMVDGKRVGVRMGSDGIPYDMARRPIDPSKLQIEPDKAAAADKLASLPTPFQSVIGRILVNSPANRRKSIEEDFANVYATGNEAELKDQIRNAAIQTENIDTKNQVQGRMATIASLNDTTAILQEMKAKGVPTNIMTGTVEDLARKLGTSTNPEYVALGNRLAGTLINYRRAATGVAFGEKEGAEYAKMFPNYKNTLPVNEALIRGLQREMKTYDDVYWESKLGKDGKKFIFGEDGAPAGGGPPKGETPDARLKRLLGGG